MIKSGIFAQKKFGEREAKEAIPNSQELLAAVSAVSHHGVDQSLDQRALDLSESSDLVSAGGVGEGDGVFDLLRDRHVLTKRDVLALDIIVCPLVEQLDSSDRLSHIAGTNLLS